VAEHALAPIGRRGVVLAVLAPIAIDALTRDDLVEVREPTAVQGDLLLGVRRVGSEPLRPQIVRVVDRESRRPARRVVADARALDQRDRCVRVELGQPPRHRQPAVAAADDHVVGRDITNDLRRLRQRRQNLQPSIVPLIPRDQVNGYHCSHPTERKTQQLLQ